MQVVGKPKRIAFDELPHDFARRGASRLAQPKGQGPDENPADRRRQERQMHVSPVERPPAPLEPARLRKLEHRSRKHGRHGGGQPDEGAVDGEEDRPALARRIAHQRRVERQQQSGVQESVHKQHRDQDRVDALGRGEQIGGRGQELQRHQTDDHRALAESVDHESPKLGEAGIGDAVDLKHQRDRQEA
ncbi:MAG: hypothetical protein BWZ10_02616 [candidate division BRC1 bacterium ADurb.BinA364]|nr:MAG: hypothetical protein BWZ10_02616 [candidate division BRC1 bacterium ADurb.BinA364]